MKMDKDSNYWKCEYENLRRKKNKQIEKMKLQQAQMCKRTLEIFNLLGYEGKDIIKLYECIR